MDNLYIIKDRLNQALTLRGMTASELSRASGLAKSSVSRYLTGENIPRSIAIGKMSKALNVNPAWVLGYDVPMEEGEELPKIDLTKLNKSNLERLTAYFQALLDSQNGE